jgi:hypothetical protein
MRYLKLGEAKKLAWSHATQVAKWRHKPMSDAHCLPGHTIAFSRLARVLVSYKPANIHICMLNFTEISKKTDFKHSQGTKVEKKRKNRNIRKIHSITQLYFR